MSRRIRTFAVHVAVTVVAACVVSLLPWPVPTTTQVVVVAAVGVWAFLAGFIGVVIAVRLARPTSDREAFQSGWNEGYRYAFGSSLSTARRAVRAVEVEQ